MSKSPAQTPSKAGAASPHVTMEDVELTNVQYGTAEPDVPLEDDIMQCARIGAMELIDKMIKSGKYSASYKDAEGITPLHWAAINNQYAVCKYLVEQGANVNAKGGESNATAAMWAAQRCHFYIVHLLLQHGADPLLADGQGYNILHLATIDGNALLLILLLHQNIPVDVPDPQGHTSLMWAGYKGWPACVDLLLRWGASVDARDDNGYTPLHWALVKGSKQCLEKLIEYGADRFAKTNDGKTPATCAEEMNSKGPYNRALAEQGYGPDGNLKILPMNIGTWLRNRAVMSKFFFFWPFLMLPISIYIASQYAIYIGLPVAFVVFIALQYIAQELAKHGSPDHHSIHKTPYLAGIFASTLFWVGLRFITVILPATFTSAPISCIIFSTFYAFTAYFYFTAMTEDPGYVPKLSSRNQQRAVIDELFALWKFDEDNFCIQCMARRPLRSKHCRRCARCVARHDHHCPWIHNCVGNNNLRHFYVYILSLEVGILMFTRLVLAYLAQLPVPTGELKCNILGPALCSMVLRDSWTITLTIWSILQLTWVTMLLVVQSVQIAKNQTTYENMKKHSEPSTRVHGHRPHHPITQGASHAVASLNDSAAASTRLHSPPRKPDGFLTRWKKMLGIDVFMATASDASTGHLEFRGNPFSRGIIGNCKDFWLDPAPIFGRRQNGEGYLDGKVIDYAHLYDTPLRMRQSRGAVDGMVYSSVAGGEGEEV